MRDYELVIVVDPEVGDDGLPAIVERVNNFIQERGGTINNVDQWGKRRLAYQIRKQRDGQYVLLNVSLPPKATADLERNLRFLEPVMRHMLASVA